ncbi:uncharacterized protein JCM6883_006563 [Sporobolomyces salmoneus]|uniref:uncharacterized protein n=1 Tax=Sporobolomyces salmoneus TaxID=183962 RepID=UPI00317793F5
MHSNLRLLLIGLLLGLLSTFYPLLPSYLPSSISRHLPFLSSSFLDPSLSQTWQSVQRYQHRTPILQNYDHSPESKWEEEVERQLRFGSKEGGREMEKELKRVRREVEKRTQQAGVENVVKSNLPVYWIEHDLDLASLEAVGTEINSLIPLSVLVVYTNPESSTRHLTLSTSSLLSSYSPSPRLVQSLLTSFSQASIPTVSSSLLRPPSHLDSLLSSLNLDKAIKLTLLSVPVDSKGQGEGWKKEELWEIGEVLHGFRHQHHHHHHVKNPKSRQQEEEEEEDEGPFAIARGKGRKKEENDALELSKRTVIISVGSIPTSSGFAPALHEVLEHSTSHARSLSLSALYSSTSGQKPTNTIKDEGVVGLMVAVEAAGEGEGEQLEKGIWRFGGLPIR